MKTYHLTIAAATGLLLATGSASAIPLAPTSAASMGIERIDTAVEPVHYRRPVVRRYHRPYYGSGPVIGFGFSTYPYASPYYTAPYSYPYPYYGYRAYPYGYGPAIGFGFRIR
ncbi:MAG TPA: hypothetical protein VMN43_11670 [Aestuariivirgaceae bacterium]|nr:hypothetical protein [Aestuariivirgaceae bacterium]